MCLLHTLLAVLLLGVPLHAQFLIDPYTQDVSPLTPTQEYPPLFSLGTIDIGGQSFGRTVIAQIHGGGTLTTSIQIGTGWMVNGAGSNPGDSYAASLVYASADNFLDLSTTPYLQLQLNSITDTLKLSIKIYNSTISNYVDDSFTLDPSRSGTLLTLDVRAMAAYTPGLLDHVDQIKLILSGNGHDASATVSRFQFSATPEPSAWILGVIAVAALTLAHVRRAR